MDFNEMITRGNRRMMLGDVELLDKTAREIQAKNIVEIGSMDGVSSLVLGHVVKDTGGHLTCYEPNPKGKWKANIKEAGLEAYVTLVMQPSPWVDHKTIPQPIDYLLIDGDHRVRWCVVDYHFFERYLRPGGRVAIHDWTGGKGVGEWIKRAVALILEDDKLVEVGRYEAKDRGMIVFEKPKDGKIRDINWV